MILESVQTLFHLKLVHRSGMLSYMKRTCPNVLQRWQEGMQNSDLYLFFSSFDISNANSQRK